MSKEEAESSGGSRSREIVERDFAEEPTTTGSVNEKTDPIDEEKIIGDSGKVGQDGVEKTSVYDRFSKRRKNLITAIVSFNCLLSPMTASIFLPSIPQISSDLNTTPTIINITVAIFIVSMGTSPLIWSPLSGFYGRRPVYLASLPLTVVATIGVAFSKTVPQLIATRILQGLGSSSSLAIGAGVVGDIFAPEQRSNAMGWYYTGGLLGPSLSPIIGAAFTQFTMPGWRAAQFFLAGMTALATSMTFFFLPETHHEPIPHDLMKKERNKKFVPYLFNPLSILGLFGWPNICAVTFISSAVLLLAYIVLVPLTVVFTNQYGLSVFATGCLYLANGGGNIIGARIGGPMADMMVRRYKAKRGYRRPEDRLRAAILGLGFVLPISCLAYGWLLQTRAGGLGPPIVFMITQAIGLMLVFSSVNTYCVDAMQDRSAEVIAVNNWMRYLFSAAASAFVLPMAEAIGWGWTMTFASGLVWVSFVMLLLVIRYGEKWRESANKRYGYNVQAEDEKHPSQTESNDSTGSAGHGEERHSAEHHDQHMELPSAPIKVKVPRERANSRASGESRLERQVSRGKMPDVEAVLQRTTSLTAPSVHGG